jgi:hypothetical protein
MFSLASWFDVQIGVIAGCALRLHWIVLIVGGQFLDLIVDLLADEVALFDPSRNAGCGAYFDEAAVVVEYFDTIAVFNDSGFFEYRSYVIAQDRLWGRNVVGFEDVFMAAVAGGQR